MLSTEAYSSYELLAILSPNRFELFDFFYPTYFYYVLTFWKFMLCQVNAVYTLLQDAELQKIVTFLFESHRIN